MDISKRHKRTDHTLKNGQTYTTDGYFKQVVEDIEQALRHRPSHFADPNRSQEVGKIKHSFQGIVQKILKVKCANPGRICAVVFDQGAKGS